LSPSLFKCRGLVQGKAEGDALVSAKAFTFAHGVEPSTGKVTDVRSDIEGSNVGGKVLFYPFGKGSTTASSWFLETVRMGNAPAALVTDSVDISAVVGSVMAKLVYGRSIPVLAGLPKDLHQKLRTGNRVTVDGSTGEVALVG